MNDLICIYEITSMNLLNTVPIATV